MSTAIYLHVPFCAGKCKYCDFLSMRADNDVIEKYFKALYNQIVIESRIINDGVSSIYIGGGTPSFVDVSYIEELMSLIFENFQIEKKPEISMEANPASSLELSHWKRYRRAGINRISLGLQSTHERHLRSLGRLHGNQDFRVAFENAREAGFKNINIDLMYALPNQSIREYEESLKETVGFQPEHISAYSLIIEEGTPFYKLYNEDRLKKERGETPKDLCEEDTELRMMNLTGELLQAEGYQKYEISNYARKDYECRHNLVYWERGDYFGFGLGAASLINHTRFSAVSDMDRYIQLLLSPSGNENIRKSLYEDAIRLTCEEEMKEEIMLGLRLTKGVDLDKIKKRYQMDVEELFKEEIKLHQGNDLLKLQNKRMSLTDKGFELANSVMKDFM